MDEDEANNCVDPNLVLEDADNGDASFGGFVEMEWRGFVAAKGGSCFDCNGYLQENSDSMYEADADSLVTKYMVARRRPRMRQ